MWAGFSPDEVGKPFQRGGCGSRIRVPRLGVVSIRNDNWLGNYTFVWAQAHQKRKAGRHIASQIRKTPTGGRELRSYFSDKEKRGRGRCVWDWGRPEGLAKLAVWLPICNMHMLRLRVSAT